MLENIAWATLGVWVLVTSYVQWRQHKTLMRVMKNSAHIHDSVIQLGVYLDTRFKPLEKKLADPSVKVLDTSKMFL